MQVVVYIYIASSFLHLLFVGFCSWCCHNDCCQCFYVFQMVWEQGSTAIVCLTRLVERDANVCHRYWPQDGSDLYHIYEVCWLRMSCCCEYCYVRNMTVDKSMHVSDCAEAGNCKIFLFVGLLRLGKLTE